MTKEFKPLDHMRALRLDESLTTTQFALLVAAVLRTDNSSCRVKMSIEGLAKDAKMSYKTARTALETPEVAKYFARVKRSRNNADFWFYPAPQVVTVTTSDEPVDDDTIDTQVVTTTTSGGNPVRSGGNGYHQSAFTSASSANTGSADASHEIKEDKEEGYEYLGTLNSEDFEGFESAESLSFDYLANSTGVAVFDALPNKVEPQAATSAKEAQVDEDKPEGAIRRVDYESQCTADGWLFYSEAAAGRHRKQLVKVGDEW